MAPTDARAGRRIGAGAVALAVGLLLAAVVPIHRAWQRDETRRADLLRIQAALEQLRSRDGHYPPDALPEFAAAGAVDACISMALAGLPGIPEDPLFLAGTAMPGPDRPCYFYRRG